MIFTVFKWGDKKAKKHALKTKHLTKERKIMANELHLYLLIAIGGRRFCKIVCTI